MTTKKRIAIFVLVLSITLLVLLVIANSAARNLIRAQDDHALMGFVVDFLLYERKKSGAWPKDLTNVNDYVTIYNKEAGGSNEDGSFIRSVKRSLHNSLRSLKIKRKSAASIEYSLVFDNHVEEIKLSLDGTIHRNYIDR